MACAASVPRQKNGPQDGPKLCTFELIDLTALLIFTIFPFRLPVLH